ncbi:MAG: hypothetical protein WBC22_12105, partial [Sedimentisphaerales bacterium]
STRMNQASRIKELYENYDLPIVLAGDLNAVPGSGRSFFGRYCSRWSRAHSTHIIWQSSLGRLATDYRKYGGSLGNVFPMRGYIYNACQRTWSRGYAQIRSDYDYIQPCSGWVAKSGTDVMLDIIDSLN